MIEPIADLAPVAWPMALTLATVGVVERVRSRRRRLRLNRALHELRRPLQALALVSSARRLTRSRPARSGACRARPARSRGQRWPGSRRADVCRSPRRRRRRRSLAGDPRQPRAGATSRCRGAPTALTSSAMALRSRGRSTTCSPTRSSTVAGRSASTASCAPQRLRLLVADGADTGLWRHVPERRSEVLVTRSRPLERGDVRRGHGLAARRRRRARVRRPLRRLSPRRRRHRGARAAAGVAR